MEHQSSISKYFILSELSKGGMHGYELISRLEKIMGKKPSPSQIYPVLKDMKVSRYVVSRIRVNGKRKVKYYKLTASGRKFFGMMNKRFEAIIKSALKEKLKICAHCDCEIFSGAYKKKIASKNNYFCCVSCARSYKNI